MPGQHDDVITRMKNIELIELGKHQTVAVLRPELAKLGIDTNGTKRILLARLEEALAKMPEEGIPYMIALIPNLC